MKSVTIATDLKDDSTNVSVSSVEELIKFEKFYGNRFFYVWTVFGWQTLSEYVNSNDIDSLFA